MPSADAVARAAAAASSCAQAAKNTKSQADAAVSKKKKRSKKNQVAVPKDVENPCSVRVKLPKKDNMLNLDVRARCYYMQCTEAKKGAKKGIFVLVITEAPEKQLVNMVFTSTTRFIKNARMDNTMPSTLNSIEVLTGSGAYVSMTQLKYCNKVRERPLSDADFEAVVKCVAAESCPMRERLWLLKKASNACRQPLAADKKKRLDRLVRAVLSAPKSTRKAPIGTDINGILQADWDVLSGVLGVAIPELLVRGPNVPAAEAAKAATKVAAAAKQASAAAASAKRRKRKMMDVAECERLKKIAAAVVAPYNKKQRRMVPPPSLPPRYGAGRDSALFKSFSVDKNASIVPPSMISVTMAAPSPGSGFAQLDVGRASFLLWVAHTWEAYKSSSSSSSSTLVASRVGRFAK